MRFIIVTNDLDAKRLPAKAISANYRDQEVSVERGVRFLKDLTFFRHNLFLKNSEWLTVLSMVIELSLL